MVNNQWTTGNWQLATVFYICRVSGIENRGLFSTKRACSPNYGKRFFSNPPRKIHWKNMLTNRCEKKLVVLLINQKDYVHYNQQTSTNEIRFTCRDSATARRARYVYPEQSRREMRYLRYDSRTLNPEPRTPNHACPVANRPLPLFALGSAQKNLFMQNKANLLNAQMNINTAITMDYVNIRLRSRFKNKANSKPIKPNQTQFKPNLLDAKFF